jgi:hypothetical protein
MNRKLKIAEVTFAAAGAVSFAASWTLNYWLWQVMPTQPDIPKGFVIPMVAHGRILYLSSTYDLIYKGLFWGGLLLFLCAVLIDFYKDPFNRRRS